jgi:hypothetical protein
MGTVTAIEDGPGFPDGFRGAGPMFAAVPFGGLAMAAADAGMTTYCVYWQQDPQGDPEIGDGCVFFERADAEWAADTHSDGLFMRAVGLTGYNDWTPKAQADYDATYQAFLAGMPPSEPCYDFTIPGSGQAADLIDPEPDPEPAA